MEHSKTPWGCDSTAIEGSYVVYGDSGDDDDEICIVSEMFADSIEHEESAARANAEFIVKACNNHDALVEALKGLMDAFIHTDGNTRGNKAKTDMIKYNQHDVPAALTAARYALEQAK